jgi:hypothetical protein
MKWMLSVVLAALTVGLVGVLPAKANIESAYEHTLIGVVRQQSQSVEIISVPDSSAELVGVLDAGMRMLVTGRDEQGSVYRVHTYMGRGYVDASHIELRGDADQLPVITPTAETASEYDDRPVSDSVAFPIVPLLSPYLHTIHQRGIDMGMDSTVFTKAGDCLTSDLSLYLGAFGRTGYNLGNHTELQPVIDYYSVTRPARGTENSFMLQSLASYKGFTASSIEDPLWIDRSLCPDDESILACEFRRTRPSIVLVMFGTNDMNSLSLAEYEYFMRLIVHDSIDHGVIPVLNTFPGDPRDPAKANQFNRIVYMVANDYGVPVMNLWLALQDLPNSGRNTNTAYLSYLPGVSTAVFEGDNMDFGHTMHNLITLQTLDRIWRDVILANS